MLTIAISVWPSWIDVSPKHEQGTEIPMVAVSSSRMNSNATVERPQYVLLQEYGSAFRICLALPRRVTSCWAYELGGARIVSIRRMSLAIYLSRYANSSTNAARIEPRVRAWSIQ